MWHARGWRKWANGGQRVKFSVLLSLYAAEQAAYLAQCLASLVTQTLAADEVVLVLDGEVSADLHAVIAEYQPRLPLVIVPLACNVGLGRALQHGLAACTHDWVLRMDTDDICVPTRFAQQVAFINAQSDISVLGGQVLEFAGSQPPTDATAQTLKTVPLCHADIARYAKSRNPINHMTVALHKPTVLAVGGYRHAPLYEDYDLWVRLLLAGARFANLPNVLVYARAGAAMYQRRGGWQYARLEWQMQHAFYRQGFVGWQQVAKNLAMRVPVRLLPNALRAWVYGTILRQRARSTPPTAG
ncbi:glycosyltransferase [Faucicola atlantae]|uniref:glycosyltransferase n=1 Tax=Faucicola atlantae TaxID=34059 RepID=UPI0025B130B2|nr:glycosyltransferase [Moraxella atlantae]